MKIKVADIRPNPFRKIDHYPIDRSKVEALKISIKDTSFWDNILARKAGNKYEIAYGHHRWIAILELGIKEINIPIRPISDYLMVKIMAEENLNWSISPAIVNETVLVAKEFLDGELAKCDTIDDFGKSDLINLLGLKGQENQFQSLKTRGAGQTTILKFLGGNWKQWVIEEALATLKDEKEGIVNRRALEKITILRKEKEARLAFRDYKVPLKKQEAIVDKIIEKDPPMEAVRFLVSKEMNPAKGKNSDGFKELENLISTIDKEARTLVNRLYSLRKQIKLLDVTELRGAKAWLAASALKNLHAQLKLLEKEGSEL